ncbi:hypothetical protein G6F46_015768 [Rhizopus delemar]|nr:hypothetical protein G6F46_015768 [Rhizopus delemar]
MAGSAEPEESAAAGCGIRLGCMPGIDSACAVGAAGVLAGEPCPICEWSMPCMAGSAALACGSAWPIAA